MLVFGMVQRSLSIAARGLQSIAVVVVDLACLIVDLATPCEAKLADFGLAEEADADTNRRKTGTMGCQLLCVD